MPVCFVCGLGIILVDNKAIVNFSFEIKKFKTRKQIDKDKFNKFMQRVCKQEEVIKLVQVNYELLPAQKQFLELGVHDSDIDVSLYQ